ncbi:hypothetical protein E3T39_06210 [Cryobacterium suzukii]|uniref:Uncharacterized protein n=1 Tax=Cryobacterium suzukii TaxID=1259198 RepID=A0A4V3ISS2_9MICO|nr:hypothetical protein [Cryobacterium suzukii]TFD61632.1 hypothetical protein E3T39_06210 [Cryobacterium suzukii]
MIEYIGGVTVDVFGYEDLVSTVRTMHDRPVSAIMETMRHWGGQVDGEYRVYWPADSFVIADAVSLAVGRELQRLFNDPRLRPSRDVPGATFEMDRPRREGAGASLPLDARVSKRQPYKRDYLIAPSLISIEDRGDTKLDQSNPRVPRLYVF